MDNYQAYEQSSTSSNTSPSTYGASSPRGQYNQAGRDLTHGQPYSDGATLTPIPMAPSYHSSRAIGAANTTQTYPSRKSQPASPPTTSTMIRSPKLKVKRRPDKSSRNNSSTSSRTVVQRRSPRESPRRSPHEATEPQIKEEDDDISDVMMSSPLTPSQSARLPSIPQMSQAQRARVEGLGSERLSGLAFSSYTSKLPGLLLESPLPDISTTPAYMASTLPSQRFFQSSNVSQAGAHIIMLPCPPDDYHGPYILVQEVHQIVAVPDRFGSIWFR